MYGTSYSNNYSNNTSKQISTYILSALLAVTFTALIVVSLKLLKDNLKARMKISAVHEPSPITQRSESNVPPASRNIEVDVRLNKNAAYSTITNKVM